MGELFSEVTASMRNNKLRTFLTGFTIAWGIIILVVLLGIGTGVRHGTTRMADDMGLEHAGTSAYLYPTMLPYAGYQKGRQPYLEPEQIDILRREFADDLEGIEPAPGIFLSFTSDYGSVSAMVGTSTPKSEEYRTLRVVEGRSFSPRELRDGERVILISKSSRSKLFKAGTNPVGEIISAGGISYRIIGVTEDVNPFFSMMDIPLATYESIYPNKMLQTTQLQLFPKSSNSADIRSMEERLRLTLCRMLKVDPEDRNAIIVQSATDVSNAMSQAFDGMDILLWVMGLGSLAIGSIGVSTIMTVSVRERMREIGIRKAIGAKPADILRMILGESIVLSMVAGGIGLIFGIGIVKLIDWSARTGDWAKQAISDFGSAPLYFYIVDSPSVNLGVAIGALIVLVAVGLISGIRPARHAIHVPAVIAMRDK